MRRLVIAAALGAAVVGTAVPSLAQSTSPQLSSPVGVQYSTDGGVFVGVTVGGRPGVAASVANGSVCYGASYEVPYCTPGVGTTTNIPQDVDVSEGGAYASVHTSNGVGVATGLGAQPLVSASVANGWACVGFSEEIPYCYPLNQDRASQALPIVVYHDSTRTVVGFNDIGVVVYSNGRICPVVSTQTWQCTPAVLG